MIHMSYANLCYDICLCGVYLCFVIFSSQRCIINNTHRLVELCVAKLSQDWFPLLELLAMATNPHCKFHIYNGTRPSESVPAGAQLADDELFARPPDPRSPKVNSCYKMIIYCLSTFVSYSQVYGSLLDLSSMISMCHA